MDNKTKVRDQHVKFLLSTNPYDLHSVRNGSVHCHKKPSCLMCIIQSERAERWFAESEGMVYDTKENRRDGGWR